MKIVFLVEELSMRYFLNGILPKLLPENVEYQIVPHNGKQDLQRSIPIKLHNWREPGVRFVVIHDRDSWDCKLLKQHLAELCQKAGRPDTLIRIPCNELEAWYFGDLEAVGQAYGANITGISRNHKYRDPDKIQNPKEEIKRVIKNLQQISGAKAISSQMVIERNISHSFQVFIEGVLRISHEVL